MSSRGQSSKQEILDSIKDSHTCIIAGAGTGKTSLIIEGITAILKPTGKGATAPEQILAITFGRKAAKEIKTRLKDDIGDDAKDVLATNLHSHAASIVRDNAVELGFNEKFSVIGKDATIPALERIYKTYGRTLTKPQLDDKYDALELFKAKGLYPDHIIADSNKKQRKKQIYTDLQEMLLSANCLTYSDLILYANRAFERQHESSNQWRYIFVDEAQDINPAQYAFIRNLAGKKAKICMVGDEDQCIYGWRGADPELMQRFIKDYQIAIPHKLEKNFRSTRVILKAANSVIANNPNREEKELYTEKEDGELIRIQRLSTIYDEARFITKNIKKRLKEHKSKNYKGSKTIAVLARLDTHLTEIAKILDQSNISYQYGNNAFYKRKSVQVAIDYLRVMHNPNNWLAFQNIMDEPKRGIRNATLNKIHNYARSNPLDFWDAAIELTKDSRLIKCRKFIDEIRNWKKRCKGQAARFTLDFVLANSGYIKSLKSSEKPYIDALLSRADDFDNVGDFLDAIAYESDEPTISDKNTVYLMTIHAAKGLEFNTVFLPAWETGQFPHPRGDIEEERRIAYVAITRAEKMLFITSIVKPQRRTALKGKKVRESQFISEIDEKCYFRKRSKKATFSVHDDRSDIINKRKILIGDVVSHNADYGYGTVIDVRDNNVLVDFNVIGQKTVLKCDITKA